LPTPIRVARYSQDFVSRGNTYNAFPFEPVLPVDSADELPQTSIGFQNIDRSIISTIRTLTGEQPSILLEIVVASDPGNPQISLALTLLEAKYDAMTITATLAWEAFLAEPYPAHSITPADFPGVFAMT
jgi:hypothetical protein